MSTARDNLRRFYMENRKSEIVNRVMRDIKAEREAEEKIERLTGAPDLLERYDALTQQIDRMAVLIEFLHGQLKAIENKRIADAVRMLHSELEIAEEGIDHDPV